MRVESNHFWSMNAQQIDIEISRFGFLVVKTAMAEADCDNIATSYDVLKSRKTVTMERWQFGRGEYKYLSYPLPNLVTSLRETYYLQLRGVANLWHERLKKDVR